MTAVSVQVRPTFFFRFVQVTTILCLAALVPLLVDFIAHPTAPPDNSSITIITRLLYMLVLMPGTLLMGVLILRRVPGNVIGLFMMIWGVNLAFITMRAGLDPVWSVLQTAIGVGSGWTSLFYIFLYFPNGEAFPRWARHVFAGVYIVIVCGSLVLAFANPHTIAQANVRDNPLFIPALESLAPMLTQWVNLVNVLPLVSFIPSLLLRYRVSHGIERRQMKWITLAGIAWPLMILSWFVFSLIPGEFGVTLGQIIGPLVSALVIYAAPTLAIGAAILRYRLYDIDIIIRRTLIYSVLTGILAIVYFGGVVVAQGLLRVIAGGNSDAAIVISTLVIAALFTPLRRRIQNIIDRRFYRRKYDAERTLAAFNATMRDEVDLDKLQAALVNVVQETMQPKQISLWIREAASKSDK